MNNVVKMRSSHGRMTIAQSIDSTTAHVEKYGCESLVVVGYDGDGDLFMRSGSANQDLTRKDVLWLAEKLRMHVMGLLDDE